MPKVRGKEYPTICNGAGSSWNGTNMPVRNWKAKLKKLKIAVVCLYFRTKLANMAPNCATAATETMVAVNPKKRPSGVNVELVKYNATQNMGAKNIVDCNAEAAMLLTMYQYLENGQLNV
jgi:hypothetical protein